MNKMPIYQYMHRMIKSVCEELNIEETTKKNYTFEWFSVCLI